MDYFTLPATAFTDITTIIQGVFGNALPIILLVAGIFIAFIIIDHFTGRGDGGTPAA